MKIFDLVQSRGGDIQPTKVLKNANEVDDPANWTALIITVCSLLAGAL